MTNGAELKLNRAKKHIEELQILIQTKPPYVYVADTDWPRRQRYLQARKVDDAAAEVSLLCGDAIHNMRAALDHAYWSRVSPFALTDGERRKLQFPFCRDAARLPQILKERLADRVSPAFVAALSKLNPVKGGENDIALYLIDELDIEDKHKLLIPLGDSKILQASEIRRQVPDFPLIFGGEIGLNMNPRDIGWDLPQSASSVMTAFATTKLNVKIDVLLNLPGVGAYRMMPLLAQLLATAEAAVKITLEA